MRNLDKAMAAKLAENEMRYKEMLVMAGCATCGRRLVQDARTVPGSMMVANGGFLVSYEARCKECYEHEQESQ